MPTALAAVLYESAKPLVIEEVEVLPPQAGEVMVRMKAAGVCHSDLHVMKGDLPMPLPIILGHEGAGMVEAVGPDVSHLQPGQHVAVIGAAGGFATHAMASAPHCLPLPASVPFEHAAAFAFTYGTTHHALIDRAALKAGETVLVLGVCSKSLPTC